MTEIIPAIMPKSYEDLVEKVGLFAGVVPLVQLDIMDGKFVPERTWPYPLGRDPHFDAIVAEEEGMPSWEDIDFEVDLMIERSSAYGSKRRFPEMRGMRGGSRNSTFNLCRA